MKRALLWILGAAPMCCALVACVPQDTERKKQSTVASATPAPAIAEQQTERLSAVQREAAADLELKAPFTDNFDRKLLGSEWRATSAAWSMKDGQVCVERGRNHPLWLRRRLPLNARVEFEATSHAAVGDIKAEFWGNGFGAASGTSYNDASSYLTIFGGWNNQFHVLARLDEHAPDRPEIKLDPNSSEVRSGKVRQGDTYRFKIERNDGRTVNWWVNDTLILGYTDKAPLSGAGHEHFAFNDWDAKLCFDNLVVTPL